MVSKHFFCRIQRCPKLLTRIEKFRTNSVILLKSTCLFSSLHLVINDLLTYIDVFCCVCIFTLMIKQRNAFPVRLTNQINMTLQHVLKYDSTWQIQIGLLILCTLNYQLIWLSTYLYFLISVTALQSQMKSWTEWVNRT